jgi:hypothetical protein
VSAMSANVKSDLTKAIQSRKRLVRAPMAITTG